MNEEELEWALIASIVATRKGVEHPVNHSCISCQAVRDDGPNGFCYRCHEVVDAHGNIGSVDQQCPQGAA